MLVKSTHADRMRENLDLFDFELTDAEMAAVAELDLGPTLFAGNDTVESVRMRHSVKVHE